MNEKIEGFFEVCEQAGLTGSQGVLIPHQNVKNLMLKRHVVDAIKTGMFHIYAVKTIEEGIELLTGMKAGTKSEEGHYEVDTIFHKVATKLKQYLDHATAANSMKNKNGD